MIALATHNNDLSAGHGISGVLYMLMKATEILACLQADRELMEAIEASVEYILTCLEESKPKSPINFSSGSSGCIPMLITASLTFPHL